MSAPEPSARINAVQSPVIAEIGALIREVPETISLGQGVAYYGPPAEARATMIEAVDEGRCDGYGPVEGIPELRQTIAEKLALENGIDCDPAMQVIVTAGSNMGFFNAILAIAEPADEIILVVPYYFNHEMAIRMLGMTPVLVNAGDDLMPSAESLEAAITGRTRAIVTVSPNNPSGVVYPRDRLQAINRLCARKGIYHISDEAYEYFLFDRHSHYSPASAAESRGYTISLYSLSKSYGFAGWRIGYMIIPPQLLGPIQKIQDTNLICATLAAQYAALGALRVGQRYCAEKLPQISANREHLISAVRRLSILRRPPVAEGAFYLLLDVNTALHPMSLAKQLIREFKVAAIPGHTFGLDGCYLRLAYGALETQTLEEGVSRIVRGLEALA